VAIESSEVVRRASQPQRIRETLRLNEAQQLELVNLGRSLQAAGYEFVAVSQETRRRVNDRAPTLARSLRDVFGWNRAFTERFLPPPLFDALARSDLLLRNGEYLKSRVSFASIGRRIFAHSAHPNDCAIFFGPETYRYASAIKRYPHIARKTVEIGGGIGVGGILARGCSDSVTVTHPLPLALDFARVNAALAGIEDMRFTRCDGLREVDGNFDLVLANPACAMDDGRDEAHVLDIVRQSIGRLTPGGTLLVCTTVPIFEGEDSFRRTLETLIAPHPCRLDYNELDPDIALDPTTSIRDAALERVAAVSFSVTTRSTT
jgi:hypothetical protein